MAGRDCSEAPTPTNAERKIAECRLKIASHGIVNSVRANSLPHRSVRAATSVRRTKTGPARRDNRHLPFDARSRTPSPFVSSRILALALASVRVTYSVVTTGPRTISSPISPRGTSAASSNVWNWTIMDADHAPVDSRETFPDANAGPLLGSATIVFGKHFPAGNGSHRQRLGRTVRSVYRPLRMNAHRHAAQRCAATGAPAESTRRKLGRRLLFSAQ